MDRADREQRFARSPVLLVELLEFRKDAAVGGFFVGRHAGVVLVVDAVGVDGNEILVEQVDDLRIGERTRSHGGGAASAALQGHGVLAFGRAAVGEEEDGPARLPGPTAGRAGCRRPSRWHPAGARPWSAATPGRICRSGPRNSRPERPCPPPPSADRAGRARPGQPSAGSARHLFSGSLLSRVGPPLCKDDVVTIVRIIPDVARDSAARDSAPWTPAPGPVESSAAARRGVTPLRIRCDPFTPRRPPLRAPPGHGLPAGPAAGRELGRGGSPGGCTGRTARTCRGTPPGSRSRGVPAAAPDHPGRALQVSDHSQTLPCMSYSPSRFGWYEPTLVVRSRYGPFAAPPSG